MSSIEETTPSKGHLSPLVLWGFLVVFTLGLCLGGAELILRIVPGDWSSAFFGVYDPMLGSWHLKSFTGDYLQADFHTKDIHLNSFGMRDHERTIAKAPGVIRIAVLGDSFVEGLQVSDKQVFARRMEDMLDTKVEVLNFGMGGFGTLQEELVYQTLARQFKPDIVVLAFLSNNDMRNNSMALEGLYNGGRREMPFLVRQPDGKWITDPTPAKIGSSNPVVLFFKRNAYLYRFLWLTRQRWQAAHVVPATSLGTVESGTATSAESVEVTLTHLSAPPSAPVFLDAWDGTEKILADLNQMVTADGAKLMVVAIPSIDHMYPDARTALEKEYGAKLPADYDVEYPEKRLGELSDKVGFAYLNLVPIFRAYRDVHQMQPPYFSYPHNGHWIPLGHDLAAHAIVDALKAHKMLPNL